MSKKYYINYAGCGQFKRSQRDGLVRAHDFGFVSRGYEPEDIDDIFYQMNSSILNAERGCGYWAWKPYIIRERLSEIHDGDYLIYTDAGVSIVKDPTPLLKQIDNKGFLVFDMKFKVGEYTKGDTLFWMNKHHDYQYVDERLCMGGVILMKKCKGAMTFINKWLYWCFYKDIITDNPSVELKDPLGFIEHRHDQSILSLLVYQNDIKHIPDHSQYRRFHTTENPDDIYFFLHGNRK